MTSVLVEASEPPETSNKHKRYGAYRDRTDASRAFGTLLAVRARREQCEHTGSERIVPPAAAGGSAGRSRPAGRSRRPRARDGAYRNRTGDLRLAKPENFRLTMRVYEPAGQLAGQTLWE